MYKINIGIKKTKHILYKGNTATSQPFGMSRHWLNAISACLGHWVHQSSLTNILDSFKRILQIKPLKMIIGIPIAEKSNKTFHSPETQ